MLGEVAFIAVDNWIRVLPGEPFFQWRKRPCNHSAISSPACQPLQIALSIVSSFASAYNTELTLKIVPYCAFLSFWAEWECGAD
jgi:hypothetical protein